MSQRKEAITQQKRLLWLCQEIKKISLHPNFAPLSLSDNLFSNKEQILRYREELGRASAHFEEKVAADFASLNVANFYEPKFASDTLHALTRALSQLK